MARGTNARAPFSRISAPDLSPETVQSCELNFVAAFLRRNIVFAAVVRANRALVRIRRILYAVDHIGLERLAFFNKLFHTLGAGIFRAGESLQIARLPARFVAHPTLRWPRGFVQCARP